MVIGESLSVIRYPWRRRRKSPHRPSLLRAKGALRPPVSGLQPLASPRRRRKRVTRNVSRVTPPRRRRSRLSSLRRQAQKRSRPSNTKKAALSCRFFLSYDTSQPTKEKVRRIRVSAAWRDLSDFVDETFSACSGRNAFDFIVTETVLVEPEADRCSFGVQRFSDIFWFEFFVRV